MNRRDEDLPENVDLDSDGVPPLEGALPEKEITVIPRKGSGRRVSIRSPSGCYE